MNFASIGDISSEPIIAPIILTALALFTRLYQIGRSNIVTWDEAHFGPVIASKIAGQANKHLPQRRVDIEVELAFQIVGTPLCEPSMLPLV
jgi:hypothetical protein